MGECYRRPDQMINFIVAHDGFTLHDLVAYNDKHNQANGESNRDGTNDNFSWNCGTEGATDDEGGIVPQTVGTSLQSTIEAQGLGNSMICGFMARCTHRCT